MWPYLRPEISRTYIHPQLHKILVAQKKLGPCLHHEIVYTSPTLPKRIYLGDAQHTNPYHLFFYMLARFYYFDNGGEIIFYFKTFTKDYLSESAFKNLPKRFKLETEMNPKFEYIEMPGCTWLKNTTIDEPWIYSYVRNLFRDIWVSIGQEKGKYTYISRNKKDITNRRVLNEEELIEPLKELGFSSYNLATLTFEQQIKLFRSSEIITGLHGAGFAWLIFCLPGTIFVEIKNPYVVHQQNHYEDISNKCDLQYIKFQDVQQAKLEDFPSIQISDEDCIVNKETYLSTLRNAINQNSSAYQTNASASA